MLIFHQIVFNNLLFTVQNHGNRTDYVQLTKYKIIFINFFMDFMVMD